MICVIPARGGSKRIPRKNIKEFHGKPIIEYSIEAAQETDLFNHIVVSTDDREIEEVSQSAGAEVHWRNPALGVDDPMVGTVAVVKEVAMEQYFEKLICALYPCAPFAESHYIRDGFEYFIRGNTDYLYVTDHRSSTDQGQFYWGLQSAWREGYPITHINDMKLQMPDAIDINTPEDWSRAEKLYEERYGTKQAT